MKFLLWASGKIQLLCPEIWKPEGGPILEQEAVKSSLPSMCFGHTGFDMFIRHPRWRIEYLIRSAGLELRGLLWAGDGSVTPTPPPHTPIGHVYRNTGVDSQILIKTVRHTHRIHRCQYTKAPTHTHQEKCSQIHLGKQKEPPPPDTHAPMQTHSVLHTDTHSSTHTSRKNMETSTERLLDPGREKYTVTQGQAHPGRGTHVYNCKDKSIHPRACLHGNEQMVTHICKHPQKDINTHIDSHTDLFSYFHKVHVPRSLLGLLQAVITKCHRLGGSR